MKGSEKLFRKGSEEIYGKRKRRARHTRGEEEGKKRLEKGEVEKSLQLSGMSEAKRVRPEWQLLELEQEQA